jgi:hypothetical protein
METCVGGLELGGLMWVGLYQDLVNLSFTVSLTNSLHALIRYFSLHYLRRLPMLRAASPKNMCFHNSSCNSLPASPSVSFFTKFPLCALKCFVREKAKSEKHCVNKTENACREQKNNYAMSAVMKWTFAQHHTSSVIELDLIGVAFLLCSSSRKSSCFQKCQQSWFYERFLIVSSYEALTAQLRIHFHREWAWNGSILFLMGGNVHNRR